MATPKKNPDTTPSPTEGGSNPPATDEKTLAEENEALKAQLAQAEKAAKAAEARLAREAFTPADQKLVDAKVAAGLDRSQAEAVVKAQKAHDAKIEAE